MVLADASIVAEVAPSAPGAPALTPEAYAETRTDPRSQGMFEEAEIALRAGLRGRTGRSGSRCSTCSASGT